MNTTQRTCLTAGILLFGLCAAKPSFAITGCTNANMSGTYNTSLTNIAFQNVITNINGGGSTGSTGSTGGTGSTGSTGSTGTTGSTGSTGTTGSTGSTGGTGSTSGGLTGSSSSLSGNTPGLGRFFFDGNGNILGLAPGGNPSSPQFAQAGTYSVASNCTATITLTSGQHYNAVIVAGGNQVLFIQSDASGNGATGVMQLAANTCTPNPYPQSFGFEFFGASAATGSTGRGHAFAVRH